MLQKEIGLHADVCRRSKMYSHTGVQLYSHSPRATPDEQDRNKKLLFFLKMYQESHGSGSIRRW